MRFPATRIIESKTVCDQLDHPIQTIDPRGVATTSLANDYKTSTLYDGAGRAIVTTLPDANRIRRGVTPPGFAITKNVVIFRAKMS